ncbi:hypothetical protein ACOMHN_035975 [Nucella lapillus]
MPKMSDRHCSPERNYSEDMSKTRKYPDYCRAITFTDNNGVVRELVFPKALDLDRPKRARTTFSREQLDRLEAEFTANQYLVGRERTQLATTLGLSETQVKVWFQNRRTKHKREKEKHEETQDAKSESLAVRSLLTSLPPSHVTFAADSHAPRNPSSLTPFLTPMHDLPPPPPPPPGLPRSAPAHADRESMRDTGPAAFSSTSSRFPEDTATTVLRRTSGPQPSSHGSFSHSPFTAVTATPPSYARDQTILGAGTLTHPLCRLGLAAPRTDSLPVCSLSSIPMQPVPTSTALGVGVRGGGCVPFPGRAWLAGDGGDARFGSLRSGVGIPEVWPSHPGYVTGPCQGSMGPSMARTFPVPAAWPLYSHSLTP